MRNEYAPKVNLLQGVKLRLEKKDSILSSLLVGLHRDFRPVPIEMKDPETLDPESPAY